VQPLPLKKGENIGWQAYNWEVASLPVVDVPGWALLRQELRRPAWV
jgi:hypothetical protein